MRLTFIKNNLNLTDGQIADELGLSEEYVEAIRIQNGLPKAPTYAKWTPKEERWIIEHFRGSTRQEVEERFPYRTYNAVHIKASRMGIRREP